MQKSLTCCHKTFYESTSSEDDTNSISSNIDLLNPRVYQLKNHQFSNIRSRRKLIKLKLPVDNSATLYNSSNVFNQKYFEDKNEQHQVTFAESEYSSGEGTNQDITRSKWKLGARIATPRIIDAIRRHSNTLSVKHERNSPSPRCSRETKSKCSIVVLSHDHKSNQVHYQLPSRSLKNHTRTSKSEHTIVTAPLPSFYSSPSFKLSSTQTSNKEESVNVFLKSSLPRQRPTRRRSRKKYTPLNVNIIQELQKCQTCKPDVNSTTIKLMAQPLHAVTPKRLCEIDNGTKRVFPFQSTPSGNLKIIPNQVVFESKKVSVLVADPKHTKVNVKAEINKSAMEFNKTKFGEEYSSIKQTPGQLPPGVTPSTIDQLQAQQKLPQIDTSYVPKTQPHRIKHHHREMEQQQQPSNQQSTLYRLSSANEVPLSSLGFTTDEPIHWDNINLPEKTDLYRELARRITNYKNADFIVRIGIDEFHCHLLVLQSYSTFFDERNCKDIDLTDSNVTSKAFSIIYDWMISIPSESCRLLRRDNILDIFVAAQYLGIKELEEQCWAFIDNDELFSEDTAFLLYLEAKKIGNTAIMELMVPRIMKFFLLLVSTKDFLELSVDELCLLLRSNYICVNSEMEVLMSAVRWLMFDWDDRKHYMLHVLKCIRFGLIAPWQLIDVKRNPENPEFMELMSFEEIRKMVDDGLAFVIIKCWYGYQTQDYYHWIDLLGLTEPTNRNWTGEDKNYVTYREFLLYLDEYQRTIMPELKLRRGKSMSSNYHQSSELPQSNRTHGNCINYCDVETKSLGQGSVSTNNATRIISKCSNTTVQTPLLSSPRYASTSAVASPATPGPPMGMGMSPEFFTKYLTSLSSNSKTDACGNKIDNGEVKIGNAALCHDTWQNYEADVPRRNYYDNNSSNECAIVNNVVVANAKYFHKKQSTCRHYDENTDSSKSEDETTMKIEASYRGHKTRRKLNKIKRTLSEENQSTKKPTELLSITTNNNNLPKTMDPTRAASISVPVNKSNFKNSERKHRPGSPYRHSLINRINFNECTNSDTDKFEQTCIQKNSKPSDTSIENGTSINHFKQNKPIQMNKSTTLLYNFDGRLSSTTPSENNTDSEETFSPTIQQNTSNKYKNLYAPESDAEQKINIDTLEKSDNYFPDYSLFHSECESVLVLGGIDTHLKCGASSNTGKDMYMYKPLENVWEFVGEIPKPRHHHSTIYLNGRVYLVGGADPHQYELHQKSVIVGTVWSYDPARRQWFIEPEMLTPRQNFGLVVSHGKMFAIGGQDKNGISLKSVESFDPLEGRWRKMQPMNIPRVGAACANFQDRIWVAGGMTKSNTLKEVECYDPIKNMWDNIEPLRTSRCFASLYVSCNSLYLIGGAGRLSTCDSMTESIKTIDIWDTNLRTWRQLTEMSIARHNHSMASIGNQLLIIGGITTVHMKTLRCVECFYCKRSEWIMGVASLPYAISGHHSVSLPSLNNHLNAAKRGDVTLNCDPKQWKTVGAYEIPLEHRIYSELNCKLIAIPVGDIVILNLTSVNQSIRTRCFVVETLEYINLYSSDLSSRFMNLKKFSHKFKNTLTTPLRDEILNDMGVMNPSLLGLPEEIQQKIAKLLHKTPLKSTSITNKQWWEPIE